MDLFTLHYVWTFELDNILSCLKYAAQDQMEKKL